MATHFLAIRTFADIRCLDPAPFVTACPEATKTAFPRARASSGGGVPLGQQRRAWPMTTTSIGESVSIPVTRGNKTNTAEQRALHQLYRAHGCMVYSRCRRLLRDRASAEDAVHETFLRVRAYLTSVSDESELVPLLCRIATNYCLKVLRKRNLQARLVDADIVPDSSPHHDEAVTRFHAKQALEHLPEQTRRVVLLTYAAGMTQDEVARSLGISRRTVVYRLSELRSCKKPKRRAVAACAL